MEGLDMPLSYRNYKVHGVVINIKSPVVSINPGRSQIFAIGKGQVERISFLLSDQARSGREMGLHTMYTAIVAIDREARCIYRVLNERKEVAHPRRRVLEYVRPFHASSKDVSQLPLKIWPHVGVPKTLGDAPHTALVIDRLERQDRR